MENTKFIEAKEVVKFIKNNSVIGIDGFVGANVPEEINIEVEKRFLKEGKPNALTLITPSGIGDGGFEKGLNRYSYEGMIQRIIAGHFGLYPKINELIIKNKVQAYNFPQGVIAHLFRDGAGNKPRTITSIGIGTFVDPDFDGGKLNEVTKEDLVEKINFDGKDYLAYKTLNLDVAIIKGSEADEKGNIGYSKEVLTLEGLSIAMNAKNHGGIVIVQVDKKVKSGSLSPKEVKIPHNLVDYIVVAKDPKNSMQTGGTQFNEDFINSNVIIEKKETKLSLNARKIIARRAALFLNKKKKVLNYGIGIPEMIAEVLDEEGKGGLFTPTIEPGTCGGIAAGGNDFGASLGADCIIDQPYMFDFYDGGGIDIAFLGLAQCDKKGNVNVSKFGPKVVGCGGFINITQSTKEIIFCGTFTANGLREEIINEELKINVEGTTKKFVNNIDQITFNGELSSEEKDIYYVTERCVFKLENKKLTLIEIAPGIELDKDILEQMDFKPNIAENLRVMDIRIFKEDAMKLDI